MDHNEVNARSIRAAFGAWVGLLVGANVMISATNSNFMLSWVSAFHVDRTAISGALSISPLVVAAAVPAAGWAMDRFGLRRVAIPGVIAFGLLFMLFSRVTTLAQFAWLQIPLGIAVSAHSSVAYAKVVSLWFDRWRGLVLGLIVALGVGVGQTSMPIVSQYLIMQYGWQHAYLIIGLIVLCVGVPLISLLVREPRFTASAQPASIGSAEHVTRPGITLRQAIRTRSFWQIFIAIMFGSMSLLGSLQHGVPMISEHGFDLKVATRAMSFAFAGVVAGQLSSGVLVNMINTPKVIACYFLAALVGLLMVHSVHVQAGAGTLYTGALLMGLGLGGEVAQNAYLVSRYFGLRSFGGIYGVTFAASNLGIAIGLLLMGRVHDATRSYDLMRPVFGTCLGISVLCIALLGPYVYARKR